MDLTRFEAPKPSLGQETGKDYRANAVEAKKIVMDIIGWPNPRVALCVNINETVLLNDMRGKFDTNPHNTIVTGKQLFYLRDIKDRLLERGVI